MFFATEPLAWLLLICSAWIGLWILIILAFAPTLAALWREPVLRQPVLIVESDDWGAGPLEQTQALRDLAELLERFKDHTGHPPVMTLAMVLAVADGATIRASGQYQRLTLEDERFTPLRQAITDGVEKGVFTLQLHGLEHYWPASLMASSDDGVRDWLRRETPQATEPLPSHLQSRWTDATTLPSCPLPESDSRAAINEEVSLYQQLFGVIPKVVVPPTFLWNNSVEAAWATAGANFIVTPGIQNTYRNTAGKPDGGGKKIRNGELGVGVHYLVRDDYFEPMLGHTAETALTALERKTRLGRPCLLETHRANFIGDQELTHKSMQELAQLLQQALETYPQLRFISTETLGQIMANKDPAWVEHHWRRRLAVLAKRIAEVPRLGKLVRLSGLDLLLNLASTK